MPNSKKDFFTDPDRLAETALKSFTSADRMTFQRKHKEPIHSKTTAKVILSTNQLPNFLTLLTGTRTLAR